MIALDIKQVQQAGDTFFSATDTAYLIFMIIGIVGLFYRTLHRQLYRPRRRGQCALLFKVTQIASAIPAAHWCKPPVIQPAASINDHGQRRRRCNSPGKINGQ